MASVGGGGLSKLYAIKTDDHSKLVKIDGTTAATATTDAVLTIQDITGVDYIESTDISFDDDGKATVTITTSKYDETTNTFIETFCPRKQGSSGGSSIGEKTSETGIVWGGDSGTSSDDKLLLLTTYGSKNASGKRPVDLVPCKVKKSSFKRSYKGNTYVDVNVELVSVALTSDMQVPAAIFDTSKVSGATLMTISGTDYAKTVFLTGV